MKKDVQAIATSLRERENDLIYYVISSISEQQHVKVFDQRKRLWEALTKPCVNESLRQFIPFYSQIQYSQLLTETADEGRKDRYIRLLQKWYAYESRAIISTDTNDPPYAYWEKILQVLPPETIAVSQETRFAIISSICKAVWDFCQLNAVHMKESQHTTITPNMPLGMFRLILITPFHVTHTHVCTCTRTHTCTHARTHARTHTHTHAWLCTHTLNTCTATFTIYFITIMHVNVCS